MAKKKVTKQEKRQAKKLVRGVADNPFVTDPQHMGPMTVRMLVDLVSTNEFPRGLDTRIMIGDTEGNQGVNDMICVTAHKPEDVVLSIDPNTGDMGYLDSLIPDEEA